MPLPPGQQIAAFVQYTKRKQEWIIASVVRYHEDRKTYDVQDKFPENRKKIFYEDIPERKVEPFPCPDGTSFEKGAKVSICSCQVLALWMIDERSDEWTTVFYKALVMEPTTKSPDVKDQTISIVFPHDKETYLVDISKVVPRTIRPKPAVIKAEEKEPSESDLKRPLDGPSPPPKRPKQEDSESNSGSFSKKTPFLNSDQQVPIMVRKESEPYQKPPPSALDSLFRVNFAYSGPLSAKQKVLRNYARVSACRRQRLPVE